MIAFLDACAVIYAVEGSPEWSEALARFDAFFLHPDLEWVELSPAVVERATLLRAELNLRTPDALQAASCLQLGADAVMVTGDAGFQRVPTLRLALVRHCRRSSNAWWRDLRPRR